MPRASAEDAFPATGTLVPLGDGDVLHVLDLGPRDSERTPLVLVHGADGGWQEFSRVAEELARDRRVLAVDRPGHGHSSAPRGSGVEGNVSALRQALRVLGVERVVLVGHSYGSSVSLRWTLDHPDEVEALVLLAPAAFWAWRYPSWLCLAPRIPFLGPALTEALIRPLGAPLHDLSALNGFHPRKPTEDYLAYSHALFLRPPQFRALAEEYRHLRRDLLAMQHRYGELQLPVHVVGAEGDRVCRVRRQAVPLAAAIPDARLTLLPDLGHQMQWHAPHAVIEAVEEC